MSNQVILIDSLEQKEWEFPGYETKRVRLEAGDYSLEGYERVRNKKDRVDREHTISIERKSFDDWVKTINPSSKNAEKERQFLAQLEIMATYDEAYVIVEACPHKIMAEQYEYFKKAKKYGDGKNYVKPGTIIGKGFTVMDGGIYFMWGGTRESCAEIARIRLVNYPARIKRRDK